MKIIKATLISILCILLLSVASLVIYAQNYYQSSPDVKNYLDDNTKVSIVYENNAYYFDNKDINETVGIIFYPGGKVEFTAYAPLLHTLAEKGVLTVLVKMPLNLAVLKPNAANSIIDEHPEITSWYIAGHSLGGNIAAYYAGKNPDKLDGLIMLAGYSTNTVTIPTLSVYGSNDGIMNRTRYKKALINLEGGVTEVVIPGANHCYFGDYGMQKNDYPAFITNREQIDKTKHAILNFIGIDYECTLE